ncbi:hypothetical protein BKA82DRAFT_3988406, partial [Pisolithus tinctorius]
YTIEQLAKRDTVSMLDIVQRHTGISFCRARVTKEQDMLDILRRLGVTYVIQTTLLQQGAKEPSIYARANVEVTRTVINAAITAGICRLVYMSSAGVIFIGTDVVNVNERVPYLEKLFDTYNDAQEVSGTRDSPTRGRLVPHPSYSSAMLSKPLQCALPPICATTEYHCRLRSSA